MKQQVDTVESSSSREFQGEVSRLLEKGYIISSTCISKREVGSYDEISVFQAILIKEIEE